MITDEYSPTAEETYFGLKRWKVEIYLNNSSDPIKVLRVPWGFIQGYIGDYMSSTTKRVTKVVIEPV